MIKNNEDLLATIDKIATKLVDGGDVENARRLLDTLSFSNVLGEVFGELRVRLLELQRTPAYERLDVRSLVSDAVQALNQALGDPPGRLV